MRKVEITTDIKTTPARVIAAFTDSTMLGEWWGVERALIAKRLGGLYTLAWNIKDNGFGFVSTGIIKEYKQDSTLIVDNFVYLNPDKPFFGPMTLTITAKEKNGITELYLCQDGYQDGIEWDWYYTIVKEAWPTVVKTLKDYLEKLK